MTVIKNETPNGQAQRTRSAQPPQRTGTRVPQNRNASSAKAQVWEKFSRVGVMLMIMYVALILMGLLVRVIFFPNSQKTSIVLENNAIVAVDDSSTITETN